MYNPIFAWEQELVLLTKQSSGMIPSSSWLDTRDPRRSQNPHNRFLAPNQEEFIVERQALNFSPQQMRNFAGYENPNGQPPSYFNNCNSYMPGLDNSPEVSCYQSDVVDQRNFGNFTNLEIAEKGPRMDPCESQQGSVYLFATGEEILSVPNLDFDLRDLERGQMLSEQKFYQNIDWLEAENPRFVQMEDLFTTWNTHDYPEPGMVLEAPALTGGQSRPQQATGEPVEITGWDKAEGKGVEDHDMDTEADLSEDAWRNFANGQSPINNAHLLREGRPARREIFDDSVYDRESRYAVKLELPIKPVAKPEACGGCTCSKSQCLKMYCPCYKDGKTCGDDCNCQGCKNCPENEELIKWNRRVFKQVRNVPVGGEQPTVTCNCKNSACENNYCPCNKGGKGCARGCRCFNCENPFNRKRGKRNRKDKKSKGEKLIIISEMD
jgi:hypothetical protein